MHPSAKMDLKVKASVLFLLLLPFPRANGGLLVNFSTGAHLSLTSGNPKRRLANGKCPTWRLSISYLSTSGKELACQCRRCKRYGFSPWLRKIPQKRAWPPTPVFLPGEFHGQRSLGGYSPWGHKESGTTERLSISEHTVI